MAVKKSNNLMVTYTITGEFELYPGNDFSEILNYLLETKDQLTSYGSAEVEVTVPNTTFNL